MKDSVDVVGLRPLLKALALDPEQDFEELFSDLWEKDQAEKVGKIQRAVEAYFELLELPNKPTVYDHLVLSLRQKDLIATFNWDPLLMDAYLRNGRAGLSLPRLAFLHGNIRIGYCATNRVSGLAGGRCKHCSEQYISPPLLYPIKTKNYSADQFIANEWRLLKWGFQNAFIITILGYSGPKTNEEALAAMQEAWGDKYRREMEQTALIVGPNQEDDKVREHWDLFIHTHHYEIDKNFYDSWIANHPQAHG